jgi:hypothetical protein
VSAVRRPPPDIRVSYTTQCRGRWLVDDTGFNSIGTVDRTQLQSYGCNVESDRAGPLGDIHVLSSQFEVRPSASSCRLSGEFRQYGDICPHSETHDFNHLELRSDDPLRTYGCNYLRLIRVASTRYRSLVSVWRPNSWLHPLTRRRSVLRWGGFDRPQTSTLLEHSLAGLQALCRLFSVSASRLVRNCPRFTTTHIKTASRADDGTFNYLESVRRRLTAGRVSAR